MRQRSTGILLHPTSLPGPYGIGDLGPAAHGFLSWCRDAGFSWWQVLPLGPTGASGSPYSSLSSFAGNPLLLSPDLLVEDGLLRQEEIGAAPGSGDARSFSALAAFKAGLVERAWERFQGAPDARLKQGFEGFREDPDQAAWLEDWVLFAALRRVQGQAPWWTWEQGLARREGNALEEARQHLAPAADVHRFAQFLFHRQWRRLREKAAELAFRFFGDVPIYPGRDSADVWARQDLFDLAEDGTPNAVAGVPPDDYSATGQLWGNPLYRWDRSKDEGFRWWVDRLRLSLERVDLLRLDHFRGFEAFWQVPAEDETAERGRWVPGPGLELFRALEGELAAGEPGELPLVAEDLGVITPEVEALRRAVGIPGLSVLQFGFGEAADVHLPHGTSRDRVIYTGTHDNDTTAGWFEGLEEWTRQRVVDYAGLPQDARGREAARAFIRLAWTSVATLAVVPAQDVLGLGSEARMNLPGVAEGNWTWRLEEGQLTPALARQLARLAEVTERRPRETGRRPEGEV